MGAWARLANAIRLRCAGPLPDSLVPQRFGLGNPSRLQSLRHESQNKCVEIELQPGIDPKAIRGASFVNVAGRTLNEMRMHIGYSVVGRLKVEAPLQIEEQNAFAVIQIGSKQFKVTSGDAIYIEKLKCDINEKLLLHKVLLLGTQTETVVGRPHVPNATVSAIVEEHALDAKVIVFKKKRRKNYRRHRGHRQMLTRIRITKIHGLDEYVTPTTEAQSSTGMAVSA